MRGKAFANYVTLGRERITPAYAGKRTTLPASFPSIEDHPRLCGEKMDLLKAVNASSGSPPPMRGKVCIIQPIVIDRRITPAYAGKSGAIVFGAFKLRDHPRLCGEKNIFRQYEFGIIGSPPPMRGKVPRSSVILDCVRITPAYAGKSGIVHAECENLWDHPRLCGEKGTGAFEALCTQGSPPPMRGKAKLSVLGDPRCQDHPRLCGEKTTEHFPNRFPTGSPPPMRGKDGCKGIEAAETGITPAYAGKRAKKSATQSAGQDHPRLCGEKMNSI